MNKKIAILVMAIVAAVLIILVLTKPFPQGSEGETGGTIGKVDKYRKVQMTEKDIVLRSEFVKDTSALARSIQGLLIFNAFAKDYAAHLKSWAEDLKKSEPTSPAVKTFEEYSTYLNNNVPAVENTIGVLTEFYMGDTTEMSLDIDKKLADFYSFASYVFLKDSAISMMIPELEKKISSHVALKDKKDEEIKRLKGIHDQMLLKTLQISLIAGDKKAVNSALNSTLFSSSNLGADMASHAGFQNISLGDFMSESKLGLFSQSGLNVAVMSQVDLGSNVGSESNLGSNIGSESKLGSAMATINLGSTILGNISNFGSIALGPAVFSSANLQNYIQSNLSSGLNSKLESSTMLNMDKLGAL